MTKMQIAQICAHRGASWNSPDNSEEAFRAALAEEADWVELDVRINRLGDLIVQHDPVFTDGRGVWSTPTDALPDGVLQLEEALDACMGMGVNIEIKNSPGDLGWDDSGGGRDVPHSLDVVDHVVELVLSRRNAASGDATEVTSSKHRPEPQQILISSFDEPTLIRVHELSADIALGYLVFDLNAAPQLPERASGLGCSALNPWDPFVDEALMERCRALGLKVNPWTVDDPTRIRQLDDLGVDSIITNTPRAARAALTYR